MKQYSIALCGATHGNELTGATIVQRAKVDRKPFIREHLHITPIISNPRALREVRRYVDEDLNRAFIVEKLNDIDLVSYEAQRAKALNAVLGPKGSPGNVDVIVDLHTTTANMGATLLIRERDDLARRVAAYVTMVHPAVRVLTSTVTAVQNAADGRKPAREFPFITEIAPHGIGIEVGPIPQGVLRADILEKTEVVLHTVLDALSTDAAGSLSELEGLPSRIEVFRFWKDLDYPRDEEGDIIGIVHPDRQDRDFEVVDPGDVLFIGFEGKEHRWQESDTVWPVFINEAAYYEKGIAMSLTTRETIEV